MIRPPEPVLVLDLFPAERAELLGLLSSLTNEQWSRPTVCAGWSVKDIAGHLLGDDLGRLSRQRDGFRASEPAPGEPLVDFINRRNEEWVQAMRRLSPRVLVDLLASSGEPVVDLFRSLDPYAVGGAVSWAGPEPAPVRLDIAREYTERWHHHQQIRDAVGAPLLTDPRFLSPVLATFVRSLPHAFRDVEAPDGASVHLTITGGSRGDWAVVRQDGRWTLYAGTPEEPTAAVEIDEDRAWRLFTKGLSAEEAERSARTEGDRRLADQVLRAVAIIA